MLIAVNRSAGSRWHALQCAAGAAAAACGELQQASPCCIRQSLSCPASFQPTGLELQAALAASVGAKSVCAAAGGYPLTLNHFHSCAVALERAGKQLRLATVPPGARVPLAQPGRFGFHMAVPLYCGGIGGCDDRSASPAAATTAAAATCRRSAAACPRPPPRRLAARTCRMPSTACCSRCGWGWDDQWACSCSMPIAGCLPLAFADALMALAGHGCPSPLDLQAADKRAGGHPGQLHGPERPAARQAVRLGCSGRLEPA